MEEMEKKSQAGGCHIYISTEERDDNLKVVLRRDGEV